MKTNDARILKSIIAAASFAALLCIANLIAFPLPGTGIPIVVQNLLAVLAGLLLGPLWGSLAVLAFLVLGALGLPVFANGAGGFQHLIGPRGGFLFGYLIAAALAGFLAMGKGKPSLLRMSLAGLAGFAIIYAAGIAFRMATMGLSLADAAIPVLFPYVLIDLGKCVVAVALGRSLRPLVDGMLRD